MPPTITRPARRKPSYDERRDRWSIYLWDGSEKPVVGHREQEWTAVAPTQERLLRERRECPGRSARARVPK